MRRILIGALVATGLMTNAANAEDITVRLQDYPGIGNMLFRIAAAKGFCHNHGIKCELQMIPSGPLGVQALLAKSVDVAFPAAEVPINAAIKGSAVQIIISGAQQNVFQIVVRDGLNIPDGGKDYKAMMNSLKGKKIGVPARGSGAELQFHLLAEQAGLKPSDFIFVAVGSPNTSFGALKSSQIDASMTFEPSGSICDMLKSCTTVYRGAYAPEPKDVARTNGASAVLVVTQEMVEKSPKTVDALIAAAKDAQDFIQTPENFAEALKIAKSYFQFKMPKGEEVMEASLKYAIPSYKIAVSRSALKQIADNMLATKQISAPFDTSRIIYAKAP